MNAEYSFQRKRYNGKSVNRDSGNLKGRLMLPLFFISIQLHAVLRKGQNLCAFFVFPCTRFVPQSKKSWTRYRGDGGRRAAMRRGAARWSGLVCRPTNRPHCTARRGATYNTVTCIRHVPSAMRLPCHSQQQQLHRHAQFHRVRLRPGVQRRAAAG